MEQRGIEGFKSFISSLGYEAPRIEPGCFTRFATNGRRGDTAGYCKLFPDGEGGIVGDFRSGQTHVWQVEKPRTEAEQRAFAERVRREQRAAQEQRDKEAKEAAARAATIWNKAEPASEAHPYLTRKGIKAYGARVHKGFLIVRGMQCDGALVVPLYDAAGALTSLQFISASGEKRFFTGARTAGCYYSIGKPSGSLIVCEGYATGASLHEATGQPVAVAVYAGNLEKAAKALRAKYPDAVMTIAADNDQWTGGNPGLTKAQQAAIAVNGKLAVPAFSDISRKPTDFNDLHQQQGAEAVRAQLEGATSNQPAGSLPASAEQWETPRPIRAELYSVEPLRLAIIPEPYRDWLADIADRMQCPIDFVAAPAIVMTSAIIGAACGIRPKREDDWIVVPNMWGGVVGNPSRLKSPALNEAMKPMALLERRASSEYTEAQRMHEADAVAFEARKSALKEKMKRAKTDVDRDKAKREYAMLSDLQPPTWRRYKTNDATVEKMSELLRDNPKGLLLFRDELIGLLATWDKEGRESDRAFFLEAWNGYGSITTDRITRGTTHTENLCVSLLGGIQPAKLTGYLYRAMRGHDNDGLMQRIQLLVYPDDLPEWKLIDRKPNHLAQTRAFAIVEKLAELDYVAHGATIREGDKMPSFRFDAEAQQLFYDWWTELERDKLRSNSESIVMEHLGKYRSLLPSLALVFHLIDVADGKATGPVSLRAAQLAAAWCEYLESHAKRIYGLVSDLAPRAAANLCKKIHGDALPDVFTARDVYRKGWELLDDRDVIEEACEMLVAHGWLKRVERAPEGIGRPPLTAYQVNPKAKGGSNG